MVASSLYTLIYSTASHKIGTDVDYAVKVTDKVNLIFKGSNSSVDWKTNFRFLPKKRGKLLLHRGYLNAWKSAEETILKEVEPLLENKELRIIGHSFGGAMSVLASVSFKEYSPEVVTFGCPKIVYFGKKEISSCGSFVQYAQYNDLVSYCIPFCRHIAVKRIGEKFNLIKMLKGMEGYHTGYGDETLYED